MRSTHNTVRSGILLHLLAWIGFFLYEQAVVLFTDTTKYNLWLSVPTYLLNVALFYLNGSVLLPRLYMRHRDWAWRYAIAALALLATYGLLRCELYLHLAPALGFTTPGPPYSYKVFWVLAIYRGTFFVFAGLGYWFARNALRVEQQKREQEQHLRAAEKGLMEANLAYLKSQINPHFLFNALNFLYAQVYPHSEDAAKGIILLSETMRYALHEDSNGKVMLTQEIQHLHNYIAMSQLRFNNQLRVDFEIVGNAQFLMIIPLILITFVENCFKHGELADAAYPLTIRLTLVRNQLTFQTRNKKRHGPKEKSTGIGLANTRQRLELTYKNNYILTLEDELNEYTCTLNILL